MSEELQKQLAAVLAKLMDVASDATTGAGSQIPPLVQEKILFGRVWETVFLFVLLALTILAGRFVPRLYQRATEHEFDLDYVMPAVLAAGGFLLPLIASLFQLHDVLQVWFAPRLYIVEWLRGMVAK